MIRIFRSVAAVIALTICLSLGSFARDTPKPLPKVAYIDAMSGLPVQSDGSGPDLYAKVYTAKGFDAYVATNTEQVSGPVQSYTFSIDAKGVHLKLFVKGTQVGNSNVRYVRIDATKSPAGTYTLGGTVSQTPIPTAATSASKESLLVAGGMTFK